MIDLRSDTITRPSLEMRKAMFEAEVGDDVWGEDPTVNELEAKVANLLGKEAALFTTSATQANQISIKVHCSVGDELLINSSSHIGLYEAGGPAALSGVTVKKIDSPGGMLGLDDLEGKIQPDDPHYPHTSLVCLENTTNMGGGRAYDLEDMRSVSSWARSHDLKMHLDGARFFHATEAKGYSPAEVGELFDTVSLCFSKGLGCPMGAVLVGSKNDIHKARRARKMLGGGCRQIGFAAAACLYALENNISRLAEDHAKARDFAEGISDIEGVSLSMGMPETNLVFFDVSPSVACVKQLEKDLYQHGVNIFSSGPQRMRAVTHLDVTAEDIPKAVEAIRICLRK